MRAKEFIKEAIPGADLAKNIGKLAQSGYRKIEPYLSGLNPARPKADNIVTSLNKSSYGQAVDPIAGRFPATQKDITHAQRTITSQAELDDLRKTGFATAGKDPNKHIGRGIDQYTGNEKWWSPADAQGRFGRNEFPGTAPVADIRVPLNKLPNGRAASTKDIEMRDPVTGEWAPFKEDFSVAEAFDRPYKLKWEKGEAGEDYDALVRLPDGSNLSIMFNEEGPGQYMVEFWRGTEQSVTGEGDAQRIFATVLAAIAKFIQQHQPQSIVFSAHKEDDPEQKSDSRIKLYNRLVQRYAGTMGYNYQSWDSGDSVQYELTRLKPGVAENSDPFRSSLMALRQDAGRYIDSRGQAGGRNFSLDLNQRLAQLQSTEHPRAKAIADTVRAMTNDAHRSAAATKGLSFGTLSNTLMQLTQQELQKLDQRSGSTSGRGGGSGGSVSDTRDMQLGSDLDPKAMMQRSGMKENFADGKKPGRKGLAKRSGVNCKQSVTKLRSIAKHSSGERQRMAHWCANMKSGKK